MISSLKQSNLNLVPGEPFPNWSNLIPHQTKGKPPYRCISAMTLSVSGIIVIANSEIVAKVFLMKNP